MSSATSIQNFSGAVLIPENAQYEKVRKLWNGMIDRRPALIAQPRSTNDVVAAIRHARVHDFKIAIRGGGHSVRGDSMCDDHMVIDLCDMHAVRVLPERRALVQGGCLLRHLDEATLPHGLVAPAGAVSHTGVAGLTLGGGFGHLMRRFGLTIDSLRGVELVTAHAEIIRVDAMHHPELFWALRGGGGNFGIVTEFDFQLHPLGKDLYVSLAAVRLDRAKSALKLWERSAVVGAPDELCWNAFFRILPALPWVPEHLAGQPVVLFSLEWCGDLGEGERHLRSLLDEIRPDAQLTGPMPFIELQSMLDELAAYGVKSWSKAGFIAELTDEVLDVLIAHGGGSPSWRSQLEVLAMGGAIDRVPKDATAFPHRGIKWAFNVVGLWDATTDDAENIAWVRRAYAALQPYATGGAYVNYMGGEEPGGVEAAYGSGATLQRLQAIKTQYDPENLFCFSQSFKV